MIKKYIERVCYLTIQRYGAGIIMNGDCFDCNKCGALIMRDRACCLGDGKDAGEDEFVCKLYGAICHNCYDNLLIRKCSSERIIK